MSEVKKSLSIKLDACWASFTHMFARQFSIVQQCEQLPMIPTPQHCNFVPLSSLLLPYHNVDFLSNRRWSEQKAIHPPIRSLYGLHVLLWIVWDFSPLHFLRGLFVIAPRLSPKLLILAHKGRNLGLHCPRELVQFTVDVVFSGPTGRRSGLCLRGCVPPSRSSVQRRETS